MPSPLDPIRVAPLQAEDRAPWEVLARGYKEFYATPTTDEEYEAAWRRLLAGDGAFGLGAKVDGELVGIAHFLFHTSTWAPTVCYLQDLFTAPASRGRGVARLLIEAVAERARSRGATRFYWLTQEHNATARALYDRVARYRGFIRYDYPL
jgi:GNAT superfamily N-acetyltransferase